MSEDFRDAFKRWAHFPKTKIKYMTLRKLRSLKTRQIGKHKSWRDFFEYLTRDIKLSPTIHDKIQEGTTRSLLATWMQNFAANIPYIRYGDKISIAATKDSQPHTYAELVELTPILEPDPEYPEATGPIGEIEGMKVKNPVKGSAIVVGRGPSLFENKHCEQLYESKYQGLVVASDGGLIPLLEAGVVPDVVVTVDGAPLIKKYFDHPLVQEYGHRMKWIVSVTASPEVLKTGRKAGLQIYWVNPLFDDYRSNESWTRLQALMTVTDHHPRGVPGAQVGGNAGCFAWIVAMSIFKRSPVALIGIDFGYPEATKLDNTQYFKAVLKMAKGNVAKIKTAYKHFYHPTFKKKAYADFVFYHYRQAFIELQESTALWYRLYGGTINCTEGGTLFGNRIKCMAFKKFLEEHPC